MLISNILFYMVFIGFAIESSSFLKTRLNRDLENHSSSIGTEIKDSEFVFSVLWGEKKKFEELSGFSSDPNDLKVALINKFTHSTPSYVDLSQTIGYSGLAGSVNYSVNNIFTHRNSTLRVIIMLTSEDLNSQDFRGIFESFDPSSSIVLGIIFPWVDCDSVTSRLISFETYGASRAICGLEDGGLEDGGTKDIVATISRIIINAKSSKRMSAMIGFAHIVSSIPQIEDEKLVEVNTENIEYSKPEFKYKTPEDEAGFKCESCWIVFTIIGSFFCFTSMIIAPIVVCWFIKHSNKIVEVEEGDRNSITEFCSNYCLRFCVIKEGYLIYYGENERKHFVNKRRFNIHPRGIIPLGNCEIESIIQPNHKFCFKINHNDFRAPVIMAADCPLMQEKWIYNLHEATKITSKNAQLGETMIRELEYQGLQLHKEKQQCLDQLQVEIEALREEVDKNEELEKIRHVLEDEKEKLEGNARQLKDQLDKVTSELEVTNQVKQTLEQEKLNLDSKTRHLQSILQGLELEKLKIEQMLNSRERERDMLSKENTDLNRATETLKHELNNIELQTQSLVREKVSIEELLLANERKADEMEQEKEYYNEQARHLMQSLTEVQQQREVATQELKDEALARISAEKQLSAAEKALEHLEMALKLSGAQIQEFREQIMPDVCKLRKFFEETAEAAQLDKDKTTIIKNALTARKSFRKSARARLRQSIRRLSSAEKMKTTAFSLSIATDRNSRELTRAELLATGLDGEESVC